MDAAETGDVKRLVDTLRPAKTGNAVEKGDATEFGDDVNYPSSQTPIPQLDGDAPDDDDSGLDLNDDAPDDNNPNRNLDDVAPDGDDKNNVFNIINCQHIIEEFSIIDFKICTNYSNWRRCQSIILIFSESFVGIYKSY